MVEYPIWEAFDIHGYDNRWESALYSISEKVLPYLLKKYILRIILETQARLWN